MNGSGHLRGGRSTQNLPKGNQGKRAGAGQAGSQHQGHGQSNNRPQRRQGQGRGGRNERFDGEITELKGAIYDLSSDTRSTFVTVTKPIAEYISRKVPNAGVYRTGMVQLKLPNLVEPSDPTNPNDQVAFAKWKIQLDIYVKAMEERKWTEARAFSIIIGQCSPVLCDRMDRKTTWSQINIDNDVIELLKLIRAKQMSRYDGRVIIDAYLNFFKFWQNNLLLNEFFIKFKELV